MDTTDGSMLVSFRKNIGNGWPYGSTVIDTYGLPYANKAIRDLEAALAEHHRLPGVSIIDWDVLPGRGEVSSDGPFEYAVNARLLTASGDVFVDDVVRNQYLLSNCYQLAYMEKKLAERHGASECTILSCKFRCEYAERFRFWFEL